jgi:mannose-6-phosphate isomerase-like protein (cupin superfamily)
MSRPIKPMQEKIIHAHNFEEYWFHEGCHILEIANHPNDPEVSIARARVEPGQQTVWHRLKGVTERYLIVEGNGIVEIGQECPTPVNKGDVVIIPPGTRQRIRNPDVADLVFYAICSPRFTPDCYEQLEEAIDPD